MVVTGDIGGIVGLDLGSGLRVKDRVRVGMVFRVKWRFPLSIQWRGTGRTIFIDYTYTEHLELEMRWSLEILVELWEPMWSETGWKKILR